MPWVKLDDKFHGNPKVLEAGLAAAGLYAIALSYCGDHLTNGVVPTAFVSRVGGSSELADKLLEHGLWETIRKGDRRHVTRESGERIDIVAGATGYFIRDFVVHNPTAEEAQRRRSERSAAGRKGAQSRWGKPAPEQGKPSSSHSNSHSSPHSDRNAPVPVPIKDSASTRQGPQAQPLRCNAPEDACLTLTFKTPTLLDEHLQNVHWIDDDHQRAHLVAAATGQPAADDGIDWDAIDRAAGETP